MLLFENKTLFPEGFVYVDDFITAEDEVRLCEIIHSIQLHTFMFQGHEARRKVASFGFNYNFEHRSLTRGEPIPPEFYPLIRKVERHLSLSENSFAELLITEYPVGSVINWHRDATPFGIVAGVSLLSDCLFKLRPYNKEKRIRKSTISLKVAPRSLYVMSGPARYDWQHSTAPVNSVRYSITLRTVKQQMKS